MKCAGSRAVPAPGPLPWWRSPPPRFCPGQWSRRRGGVYFLDVDLKDGAWDGFTLGRELRRRDPHGTLIYITTGSPPYAGTHGGPWGLSRKTGCRPGECGGFHPSCAGRTPRAYLAAWDKIEAVDWRENKVRVGGRTCLLSRAGRAELKKKLGGSL